MPTDAKMDLKNRALCFALRHPAKGGARVPLHTIVQKKMVKKTDGTVPTEAAISLAAKNFAKEQGARGRPAGTKATTRQEDRAIMSKFKQLRPPGAYVDSRIVHKNLPKKIQEKVGRRTVLRRLAAKGYVTQTKLSKTDLGPKQCAKRTNWCRKFKSRTPAQWKAKLQGCGDIKEFTYYPRGLRSKFKRLRSSRTIMSKAERQLPAFQRPKKWFNKAEWKTTKKQKVFGLTTSSGKICTFLVPSPFNAEVWADLVRAELGPFMRRAFPRHSERVILLDGEKILRAPAAKKAYGEFGITLLPGWPANSPELNPQENVWPWAENHLRTVLENDNTDTFDDFKLNAQLAVAAYETPENLIPSMAARVRECLEKKGNMIGR